MMGQSPGLNLPECLSALPRTRDAFLSHRELLPEALLRPRLIDPFVGL